MPVANECDESPWSFLVLEFTFFFYIDLNREREIERKRALKKKEDRQAI